jgi:hypothetical protein
MALGWAQIRAGFQDPQEILGDRLREGSLYRLLADHGPVMFPTTTSPTCTPSRREAGRRSRPGRWERCGCTARRHGG